MADLLGYSKTRNGSVTTSVPRYDVVATIKNQKTGVVYQTVNTTWPGILNSLTAAELDFFLQKHMDDIAFYLASKNP